MVEVAGVVPGLAPSWASAARWRLVVAGGVGANRELRVQLNAACAQARVRVHYPELHLCTDNGAMIAMAAAMRLQSGVQTASLVYAFDVKPRWPLDAL